MSVIPVARVAAPHTTRRGFLATLAGLWLAPAAFARAAEPTYTVTLPDKQKLHLQVVEEAGAGGEGRVRVVTLPQSVAKSDLLCDAFLTLDTNGKPDFCHVFFGPKPGVGANFEAVRNPAGSAFDVRVPAAAGSLLFGGTLIAPLVAELFIGRLYDWKRGGTQTFAMLVDAGVPTAEVVTLKLTADGVETLTLPDGPVTARRLRYDTPLSVLPKDQQTGVFWVGPLGEVLRCDTAFFGVPLRAKGVATREDDNKRLALRFANPGDPTGFVVLLRADRQAGGYAVALEIEGKGRDANIPLASLTCDSSYRLQHLETPWHGRPFVADVVGNEVRYRLPAQGLAVRQTPTGRAWFLPYWFATDIWEAGKGAWADLAIGETRDGDYLPLFTGDYNGGGPFALERLPDRAVGEGRPALHVYRFSNKAAGEVKLVGDRTNVYDVYTDGKRLVAFIGSDKSTIIRDGWEAWAAGLAAPAPVAL